MPIPDKATTAERRREQRTANRIKAMSHPVRAATLRYLNTHGIASPSEVADHLGEDVSNVSYHLKQLVALDCAEEVGTQEVRGVTLRHLYQPVEGHVVEAGDWSQFSEQAKSSHLAEVGGLAFDDFWRALERGTLGCDELFSTIRLPLSGMDRQGLAEIVAMFERDYREIQEIRVEAAKRLQESGQEPIRISCSLLAFEVPHF